jgi:hypothetical protein
MILDDFGYPLPTALSFAFAYHDLNLSKRLVRLIEPFALVTYVPMPAHEDPSSQFCLMHSLLQQQLTRLVVMKLIIAIAIQHAIDLEDIGVRIRPRELVACAIEA